MQNLDISNQQRKRSSTHIQRQTRPILYRLQPHAIAHSRELSKRTPVASLRTKEDSSSRAFERIASYGRESNGIRPDRSVDTH